MTTICLLDNSSVRQKIKRIAWQIYEYHHTESKITLYGVKDRGLELASHIAHELATIADFEVVLGSIDIDKENPLSRDIRITPALDKNEGGPVLLVDDVANTGKTLTYALKPFLEYSCSHIQTVVLVDRSYKRYPVQADFVGHSLSTTLQEHVEVRFEDDHISVHLH
jgi:pyrimidine operon attenuation protein/uracil phosphoribosyltransferase